MIPLLILQLWASFISPRDRAKGIQPNVKFWGNWQSCIQDDGAYAERAFPYTVNGKVLWTFHMGPSDQFALFKGVGPADEDDDHDDPKLNLLGTSYRYNLFRSKTGNNWTIPSLGLRLNIVAAMGSRSECDSFVLKLEDLKQ